MDPPRLRPLGVGEVLDIAINIVLRNARTLFKVVATVVIPLELISVIVLASTVSDSRLIGGGNGFGSTSSQRTISSTDFWSSAAGGISVGIISLLLTTLATAACFKAISDAYLGGTPDWRGSLRFAGSHARSVIWLAIANLVGLSISFLLLLIPGIYFYAAWAVATPALLFEGVRGTRALGRSRQLVSKRWWPTAGTLLVTTIVTSIAGAIFSALVLALNFTGIHDSVLGAATLNGVSRAVTAIVTTPITAAVATVIYYDLRVRKEGFDLQLITERLGVIPAEGFVPRAARPVPGAARPQLAGSPQTQPPAAEPPGEWLPPHGTAPDEPASE